jgi:hypothetical protein
MKKLFTTLVLFSLMSFAAPVSAAPSSGSLVKLACPKNAMVNDPCKAVYFFGHDGKRHAFPNDKVYFTWYTDFSTVQTVTPAFLASLQLGTNVVYRPGIKLVKFLTDPKVYVVGLGGTLRWLKTETAATSLYGADWNKKVDDIADTFYANYRFGADVETIADFGPANEAAIAPTIDQNLESTYQSLSIATENGSFDVSLITMQKDRFNMITETGNGTDCSNNCDAKSLLAYATGSQAMIGMHGTYFCPPDYADCTSKINTFLGPVFDTSGKSMINSGSLAVHEGPMVAMGEDGDYVFAHRTKELGNSVSDIEAKMGTKLHAAISNYPSLVENGTVIVQSEARLDDGMKTMKSSRGAIGYNERFIFLVIAKQATVVDLAKVMKAIGSTYAMNLDGGGSSAMLWNGSYVVGPGRNLPNAILFAPRN